MEVCEFGVVDSNMFLRRVLLWYLHLMRLGEALVAS